MQKTTFHHTNLTAAAFFLIGTLAVAQTPSTAQKKLPGRMKSGQIVVTRIQSGNDSGATTPQSAPTERKDGAVISADYNHPTNDRNSAHATESLAPSNIVQQGKNPLYEDKGKSGTNPLFESGKDSVVKTNTSTSGEAGVKPGSDAAQPQATLRKHIAGVKYEDRTAGSNTGSTNAQGMAVNEQGSSTARPSGKKHHN